jgi:hypothetical protein
MTSLANAIRYWFVSTNALLNAADDIQKSETPFFREEMHTRTCGSHTLSGVHDRYISLPLVSSSGLSDPNNERHFVGQLVHALHGSLETLGGFARHFTAGSIIRQELERFEPRRRIASAIESLRAYSSAVGEEVQSS